MSQKFEVNLTWEVEDGISIPLTVTGRREPVIPAITRGNPEDLAPAEGGEIYIDVIRSGGALPPDVDAALRECDRFLDAVGAAI